MATALSHSSNENLEFYTLIWLDKSANESHQTIDAQKYFRISINYLKIFQTSTECINYIKSTSTDERIVLIVSGSLGRETVPQIHDYRQVSAVYVYCMNKAHNEQWAKNFPKIRDILTDLKQLVNKIRDEQKQRQRNKVDEVIAYERLIKTSNSFEYSYAFIECLLKTSSNLNDKIDLINLCKIQYEDNEIELKTIEEFEQNYVPSKAIQWYTRQSFLYRLLNKALVVENLEILLLFRFFLHDLERQIGKQLCQSPVHVYAGQILSNEDFQLLKDQNKGLIIMKSFLFTSTRVQIEKYFDQTDLSPNYRRVLFEIDADPRLPNIKPFAYLKIQSSPSNEDQTLFMCGSIFRIDQIRQEHNEITVFKMKLCSFDESELKSINDRIQTDDVMLFGRIFCQMNKYEQAEKFYKHLIANLPDDHVDLSSYYEALGYVEKKKGDYDESLNYLKKSLAIKQKIFDADHPVIADCYMNMGEVYQKKNEIKRALEALNTAMDIYKKNKYPDEHPKIASCWMNIGQTYNKDKKYSKALECFERILANRSKRHEVNLFQSGEIHRHLGDTHNFMNNPDKALENYLEAIKYYEKLPSPPYLVIGQIQKNIGIIYEKRKKYSEARSTYEQAMNTLSNVLPLTDTLITQIQTDIQRVSMKIK